MGRSIEDAGLEGYASAHRKVGYGDWVALLSYRPSLRRPLAPMRSTGRSARLGRPTPADGPRSTADDRRAPDREARDAD